MVSVTGPEHEGSHADEIGRLYKRLARERYKSNKQARKAAIREAEGPNPIEAPSTRRGPLQPQVLPEPDLSTLLIGDHPGCVQSPGEPVPSHGQMAILRSQVMTWIRSLFSNHEYPFNIPAVTNLELPSTWLRSGIILMPKRTELRVRYWMLEDPKLLLADLIPRMLSKGLEYQHRAPISALTALRPTELIPSPTRPSYINLIDPLIESSPSRSMMEIVNEWDLRSTALMSRGYARRLMMRGGIIGRIAKEKAPPGLWKQTLQGPSMDVTLYGNQDLDIVPDTVNDVLREQDIAVLLGVTTFSQSLWPPEEFWNSCPHYHGEWTADNERWFQKHLHALRTYSRDTLRSRAAWRSILHPHSSSNASNPDTEGTEASAARACAILGTKYGMLWEDRDLIQLD
jgi:hypothetical protein